MADKKKLNGKVILLTGAGGGIGRVVAIELAHQGALIGAAGLHLSNIEATVQEIRSTGGQAIPLVVDVANWQSVQGMIQKLLHEFGRIHGLVNVAGIQGPIGPLAENDPAGWEQVIQTNLVGTFYCCKAILPHMIQSRVGKIVNFSGGGATAPRPFYSAYAASKAAVVRLTETLAEEVKDHNIQVNAVAPGAVNTHMLNETLASGEKAGHKAMLEAQKQLQVGGTPPQVPAGLVAFLMSDASGMLSGKLISAPHDFWEKWDNALITKLMEAPWLTLRRIDHYTLEPLIEKLNNPGTFE